MSFLELCYMYSIMLLIDKNNELAPLKLVYFGLSLLIILSIMNFIHLSFYMIFTICLFLFMYVLLSKRSAKYIIGDIVLCFILVALIQLPTQVFISILNNHMLDNRLVQIIILTSLIIILNVLRRFLNNGSTIHLFYYNNRLIIFFVNIFLIILFVLISHIYNKNESLFNQEAITFLLIVALFIVIAIIIGIILFQMLRERSINKMLVLNEESQRENIKSLRKKEHDYNGQINGIIAICEEIKQDKVKNKLINYSKEIIQKNAKTNISGISDNTIVTSYLSFTKKSANAMGVDFVFDIGNIPSEYNIPASDLTDLLSNLSNNAIEATLQLTIPREEKKVFAYFGDNFFKITNPVKSSLTLADMKYYSKEGISTKGKDRGLGMSNIINISQKYNILYTVKIENCEITFEFCFNDK